MTLYARLTAEGLVLETCDLDPSQCFHPDIAQEFQEVPAGAEAGDTITDGEVIKPVAPPEPELPAEPIEKRLVPRADFMGALTRAERIALTTEAESNAELRDFLELLQINGNFDLSNAEDVDLLDQLQAQGVLSEASVAAIKTLR